jgi:hypothetical protein
MGEGLSVNHFQKKREGLTFVSIDSRYFLFPDGGDVNESIRIEGAVQPEGAICVTTKYPGEKVYIIDRIVPKTS